MRRRGFRDLQRQSDHATNPFLITATDGPVTINDGNVLGEVVPEDGSTATPARGSVLEQHSAQRPLRFRCDGRRRRGNRTLPARRAPAQGLLRFDDLFGAGGPGADGLDNLQRLPHAQRA